jgi:hypothetical protein
VPRAEERLEPARADVAADEGRRQEAPIHDGRGHDGRPEDLVKRPHDRSAPPSWVNSRGRGQPASGTWWPIGAAGGGTSRPAAASSPRKERFFKQCVHQPFDACLPRSERRLWQASSPSPWVPAPVRLDSLVGHGNPDSSPTAAPGAPRPRSRARHRPRHDRHRLHVAHLPHRLTASPRSGPSPTRRQPHRPVGRPLKRARAPSRPSSTRRAPS